MSNPMNITIPVPTATPGPEYAQQVSTGIETITTHNHTTGQGNPVPSAGLNINADLPFNEFTPTNMGAAAFVSLATALANVLLNRIYVVEGDFYLNDGQGRSIRLTQNGEIVNGAAGNIQGLVDPASASYNPSIGTFTWEKGANIPAAMDFAELVMRNATTPTNSLTHQVPLSLAAAVTVILAGAVPASPLPLVGTPSGSTITQSYTQIITAMLADLAVTAGKIANKTITQAQVIAPVPLVVNTFETGFSGSVKYWKDVGGVVHLTGSVNAASNPVFGNMFTLPAGYRPSIQNQFRTVNAADLSAMCTVFMQTNGDVLGITTGSGTPVVYVDGITFLAS